MPKKRTVFCSTKIFDENRWFNRRWHGALCLKPFNQFNHCAKERDLSEGIPTTSHDTGASGSVQAECGVLRHSLEGALQMRRVRLDRPRPADLPLPCPRLLPIRRARRRTRRAAGGVATVPDIMQNHKKQKRVQNIFARAAAPPGVPAMWSSRRCGSLLTASSRSAAARVSCAPPRPARSAPPPPSRTNWTRLVHPSVLTGHIGSPPRRAQPAAGARRGRGRGGAGRGGLPARRRTRRQRSTRGARLPPAPPRASPGACARPSSGTGSAAGQQRCSGAGLGCLSWLPHPQRM